MIDIAMWQVWVFLSLIMFLLEVFYPMFFFAALGAAALVSMVFSFFFNIQIQFLVFSISALVVFFAVRPKVLKKLYTSDNTKTNAEAIIGKEGVVVEDIGKTNGRIKIGDETWIGISINNQEIKKGETVIVEQIDGIKLYVKRKGG